MLELNQHRICDEAPDLVSHGIRTAQIAVAIARFMDLPRHQADVIGFAARLHDIGKTRIDPEILNKPGPLDADEWVELQRHPQLGYDLLRSHVDPEVATMVLMHHERLDGGGYPGAVGGGRIDMSLRILHVADAYDAITSERPYQEAMSVEYAISELTAHMGTQFDPDPVQALLSIVTHQEHRFTETIRPFRVPSTLAAVS
ncbi:MAG: HD domain-containing protein [Acidimicrobiia bacterium]